MDDDERRDGETFVPDPDALDRAYALIESFHLLSKSGICFREHDGLEAEFKQAHRVEMEASGMGCDADYVWDTTLAAFAKVDKIIKRQESERARISIRVG